MFVFVEKALFEAKAGISKNIIFDEVLIERSTKPANYLIHVINSHGSGLPFVARCNRSVEKIIATIQVLSAHNSIFGK